MALLLIRSNISPHLSFLSIFSIHVKELTEFGPVVMDLLDFIQDWSCGTGSALICLNGLIKNLVDMHILDESAITIFGEISVLSSLLEWS